MRSLGPRESPVAALCPSRFSGTGAPGLARVGGGEVLGPKASLAKAAAFQGPGEPARESATTVAGVPGLGAALRATWGARLAGGWLIWAAEAQ